MAERAEREEPRQPWLAPSGVRAIDDRAQWEEGEVLDERSSESADLSPSAQLGVGHAEEGAVGGVHREPGERPRTRARQSLAEDGDVRVVVPEESPVERLDACPDD